MTPSWGRYPVGMLAICQRTDRATAVGRQSYRRKGKRRCHEKSLGPSDESNRIFPFWEVGRRRGRRGKHGALRLRRGQAFSVVKEACHHHGFSRGGVGSISHLPD